MIANMLADSAGLCTTMFATSCLAYKLSVLHSETLLFILVLDDHFGNTTDGPFSWSPGGRGSPPRFRGAISFALRTQLAGIFRYSADQTIVDANEAFAHPRLFAGTTHRPASRRRICRPRRSRWGMDAITPATSPDQLRSLPAAQGRRGGLGYLGWDDSTAGSSTVEGPWSRFDGFTGKIPHFILFED
jgi:hypothetical protein